jgi:phosphohistidine swiveling domain-containing protein
MAELGKLVQGDILVAPMTNPVMVVAMRKCSAIVTDAGGVTSHAAVISREFGIPCVTGTQNATKLLKENSIIAVDGTRGVVKVIRFSAQVKPRAKSRPYGKAQFIIFGNKVMPFHAKIIRSKPLSPKVDYEWKEPHMNEEYWWVTPRPEIHGSLFQRSLGAAGIQRIPYAFGFTDLSPLYVRYYDNTAIHLDTIQTVLNRLKHKLMECDKEFWRKYLDNLYSSYKEFDEETVRFQAILDKMTSPSQKEIVRGFVEWLVVHNRFFSQTYLIQSIGDDVVWPAIRNTVQRILKQEKRRAEWMTALAAPLSDADLVTSSEFAIETQRLIEAASSDVRKIIESDLDEKLSIELVQGMESGKQWMPMLRGHLKKWWWIRERDPYFEPITDEIGMLAYMRRYAGSELVFQDRKENARKFAEVMSVIETKLNPRELAKFRFLLEVGRTLSKERDIHHHIWIKNVSIIRKYIQATGYWLKELRILQHEKDIYFLTLPEIVTLLQNPSDIRKEELSKRVNLRIAHVSQVTKLRLHREVIEAPPPFLDDAY